MDAVGAAHHVECGHVLQHAGEQERAPHARVCLVERKPKQKDRLRPTDGRCSSRMLPQAVKEVGRYEPISGPSHQKSGGAVDFERRPRRPRCTSAPHAMMCSWAEHEPELRRWASTR